MGEERLEGVVVPLNPDGSRKKGPRWRDGESMMTGSAQTRESKDAYIAWLVLPRSLREPSTKQEMAEYLGVTPRALNYWEKEPYVMREVSRLTKNSAKIQDVPDVLAALLATAKDTESSRQVQAAKVFLDHVESAVEEVSAEELADMTNQELANLLADIHDLVLAEEDEE